MRRLSVLFLPLSGVIWAVPDECSGDLAAASTRSAQIEAERRQKAGVCKPPAPDRLETALTRFENHGIVSYLFQPAGWRAGFGALETGSGFALGAQYVRPDLLHENLTLKFQVSGTLKEYWGASLLLSLPRLLNDRVQVDGLMRRLDAPQVPYYGPGNTSHKEGRTDFRRESNTLDVRAGWRIDGRHVLAGVTLGVSSYNVGPGTSSAYASAESVYSPLQAAGIDQQTTYTSFGPFVQIDFRDRKDDPHRGTNFVARYNRYLDTGFHQYSFQRLESVLEQYVPLLNEKRVFAFRARTDLTFTGAGQRVPFYMQPTLGGADDVRGFRSFRFYDNNRLFSNLEYRWEVAPPLDMAVFFDAGKVFAEPEAISLSQMRVAAGGGFRFKTRGAVVFRVDAGLSNEGFMVWFKFNSPFQGLLHNMF